MFELYENMFKDYQSDKLFCRYFIFVQNIDYFKQNYLMGYFNMLKWIWFSPLINKCAVFVELVRPKIYI